VYGLIAFGITALILVIKDTKNLYASMMLQQATYLTKKASMVFI